MSARPSIEATPGGAIVCTGEGIAMFQLLALRGAVKLEKLGMKRRGVSACAIAREQLGLGKRAKPDEILAALAAAIAAQETKLVR